jgi:ankyrin repeat protein
MFLGSFVHDILMLLLRFLLAELHIQAIAEEPTVGHLEFRLKNLPQGLDETYEHAMARIDRQGKGFRDLAIRILTWIVHAKRQLRTAELQHAVAVEPGSTELDTRFIPDVEIIGSICAGLITIDTQSDIIRLAHYTTQDYFDRTPDRLLPNAVVHIARSCMTYLSFDAFKSKDKLLHSVFKKRLQTYPLYEYSARNWANHVRQVPVLVQEVLEFLKDQVNLQELIQVAEGNMMFLFSPDREMSVLHVAAYFGLDEAMKAVLRAGASPDPRTIYGRTPLSYAAENGHDAAVKLLVDTEGVDVNSKDYPYRKTPFSYAVMRGQETTIKLLLDTGRVYIDSHDNGQGALSTAVLGGHDHIVKMLLDTSKFDINHTGMDEGRNALMHAASYGYDSIVKMLLGTGKADINSRCDFGMTALSYAADGGWKATVKLLMESRDININSKDIRGMTPVRWAAFNGHKEVVKLLYSTGKVEEV